LLLQLGYIFERENFAINARARVVAQIFAEAVAPARL
jgi:hypothetical protein